MGFSDGVAAAARSFAGKLRNAITFSSSPHSKASSMVEATTIRVCGGEKSKDCITAPEPRFQSIGPVLTNLRKFAVESAISLPSKPHPVFGDRKELQRIVRERLNEQALECRRDGNANLILRSSVEDMRAAETEKVSEGTVGFKEESQVSVKHKSFMKVPSPEQMKETDIGRINKKRIMIRSRL
ncbi:hypothetical protein Dimus_019019 [Dionaea muscipula]